MKKLFFAAAVLLVSCSQYGPRNPYLGCLPAIQEANAIDYQKHKDDDGVYLYDRQPKFNDLQAKEFEKLKGARLPMRSGHDFLTIVGDCAFFDGESYYVLLEYNCPVYVRSYGSLLYDVVFCQSKTEELIGYVKQIYSMNSGRSWDWVVGSGYGKGEHELVRFSPNISNLEWLVDAKATDIQKKVDCATFVFSDNDIKNGSIKPISGKKENYTRKGCSAVDYAIKVQEEFYKMASEDNLEAFSELDFGLGESEDDDYDYKTYEIWKVLYPEKWKVIADYRKKKFSEDYIFCICDTDDSIFAK